jgi:hypothetical protein
MSDQDDKQHDDDTRDDQDVDQSADDQDDDDADRSDDQDDAPLGPKGEKALQAEKEKRRAAQTELREFKALGLTPAQIKALQKPGDKGDKADPDVIREQVRREVQSEALAERVVDKIEARAARRFADAEDAVAILMRNRKADDFLDGDKIDVEAIQDALDELLEKKPHLAVQDGKRFKGDADGGTRKESRPAQLTRDDLKRMSPKEITKAKAEGRLADLLGSK